MSYRMFLDDVRDPPDGDWVVVRSYIDAISYMMLHDCPQFISFDHDLGLEHYAGMPSTEKTGFDVAKWMIETDLDRLRRWIPGDFAFTTHSMNPVGRENIVGLMTAYLSVRDKLENS